MVWEGQCRVETEGQTDRGQTDRQRDRQTDRALSQHVSAPAVPGGRSAGILTRRRSSFALEPHRHRFPPHGDPTPGPPPAPSGGGAQAPHPPLPRHGALRGPAAASAAMWALPRRPTSQPAAVCPGFCRGSSLAPNGNVCELQRSKCLSDLPLRPELSRKACFMSSGHLPNFL